MNLDPETVMVAGYAAVLLGVALLLDRLARHVHERANRFRTAGFRYHPDHDSWSCPEDQVLWPQEFDSEKRLVRYRAKPSLCNACPVKHDCTTSAHGREIVRAVDPWPHSEAGRFHRGIALTVVVLSGSLSVACAVTRPDPTSLAVLSVPAVAALVLGWRLTEHLRHTPSGFPDATAATGLRVAATSRTRWGASRAGTRWGSGRGSA